MSLGKNRLAVFAKGLGNFDLMEKEPSEGTDFINLGSIENTVVGEDPTMTDVIDECGDLIHSIPSGKKCSIGTNLHQSGIDEIDFIRAADSKIYAARYHGPASKFNIYQYFCVEKGVIPSKLLLQFAASTHRKPPMIINALKQADLDYDVPGLYVWQGSDIMAITKCKLWIDPMMLLNTGEARILDISGFGRHGTLNASTLWQSGGYLRLDGTDDYVSFGDILDDDGSADIAIEAWIRIQGADGSQQEILSKKSVLSDDTDGFVIYRNSSNKIVFKLSDGAASVSVTSTTSLLQNVWKHIMVAVDRNGNATTYFNGVADGAPQSVSALGSGSNSVALYLGRAGTLYGQVDAGAARFHSYGAGSLPSDIATIALNHYNSERAKYGL